MAKENKKEKKGETKEESNNENKKNVKKPEKTEKEKVEKEIKEKGSEEEISEEKAEEVDEEEKRFKSKKLVKKRKSKKEKENPLSQAIRLTVETGKVEYGLRKGIKNSLLGKAKVIVIAENAPKSIFEDISYYCKLSEIPLIVYKGSSIELGSICGKPYPVMVLTIYDEGTSNILKLAKG